MKIQSHGRLRRSFVIFLQLAIILLGLCTFLFLLWEPLLEGKNQSATWFQIYFNDLFLLYAYAGAIAFFIALYSAFRLLGYVAHGEVFAKHSLDALKRIKICAIIVACFALGFELYLHTVQRKIEEDIAGGVMMGLLLLFGSTVTAILAGTFQKKLTRQS